MPYGAATLGAGNTGAFLISDYAARQLLCLGTATFQLNLCLVKLLAPHLRRHTRLMSR